MCTPPTQNAHFCPPVGSRNCPRRPPSYLQTGSEGCSKMMSKTMPQKWPKLAPKSPPKPPKLAPKSGPNRPRTLTIFFGIPFGTVLGLRGAPGPPRDPADPSGTPPGALRDPSGTSPGPLRDPSGTLPGPLLTPPQSPKDCPLVLLMEPRRTQLSRQCLRNVCVIPIVQRPTASPNAESRGAAVPPALRAQSAAPPAGCLRRVRPG